MTEADLQQFESLLPQLCRLDRLRLARQLAFLQRRCRRGLPVDRGLARLRQAFDQALEYRRQRLAHLPAVTLPEELPITAHAQQIIQAIRQHQVLIVAGDTGSGKSTQLPKLALLAGRGIDGQIGHTQPRRIAARSLAARIAAELNSPLGQFVGYKVRFDDQVSPQAYIKLMTDGILLAETRSDRRLDHYDTIIIDEAHERSLNIDFLLGYLKLLLPHRPDLKLIITSATIDPERFSRFFDNAPVLEVSGRSYPVEIRYRPIEESDPDLRDEALIQAIVQSVREILASAAGSDTEVSAAPSPGDILVFLPGEREIRDTAHALRQAFGKRLEILPLYARLSPAQQQRVFEPHAGLRVVLATNVAETSLTVPNIRWVVDSGLARISRYNPRARIQRLPIEPISQASANQRAGRCGRIGPGVCIRLYSQEDFERRPAFTQPEILRSNLAAVILRMKDLDLGEPERFPFLDPPSPTRIRNGYQTLFELGALDNKRRLTPIGRRLALLPIDPRLGRMILAAHQEKCLREVLVIAAALAVQDPRERPMDQPELADRAQAPFRHDESDFLTLWNLWQAYHLQTRRRAGLRAGAPCPTAASSVLLSPVLSPARWCRQHFVSFVRMREWIDVHRQLLELLPLLKIKPSDINSRPASYDAIHRALLTGLLSNVGLLGSDGEYQGPYGSRFRIFPGSTLFRRHPPPRWIMAAELVETNRLWARTVARIRPAWIERLGKHLIGRDYFQPFWDERLARVLGFEKVVLHGLVLQDARRIDFGPIAPRAARDIFIQEGLVQGRYQSPGAFLAHNLALEQQVRLLEAKLRRSLLVDESRRFDFYDRRIPTDIYTARHFEAWRRRVERDQPRLLFMDIQDLLTDPSALEAARDFPDTLELDGLSLPLTYRHQVGDEADGITLWVPLPALLQLTPAPLDYLVPGRLPEKIEALLRTLPKSLRVPLSPLPALARQCASLLKPSHQPLTQALSQCIRQLTGLDVPPQAFQPQALPEYLHMRLAVVDPTGRLLACGRDLRLLQQQLADQVTAALAQLAGRPFQRDGLRTWDFPDLPEFVELTCDLSSWMSSLAAASSTVETPSASASPVSSSLGSARFRAYPALIDRGQSVSLRLLAQPVRASRLTHAALRRLYLLELENDLDQLLGQLPDIQDLFLHYVPLGPPEELRRDLLAAVVERVFLQEQPGGPQALRSAMEFHWRLRIGLPRLPQVLQETAELARRILLERQHLVLALARLPVQTPALSPILFDLRDQLDHLLPKGFLLATPARWLVHLPRYLRGMSVRLEKAAHGHLARDLALMDQFRPWWERFLDLAHRHADPDLSVSPPTADPALADFRFLLEEMRIWLFAQELGTAVPVSWKRLEQAWSSLLKTLGDV